MTEPKATTTTTTKKDLIQSFGPSIWTVEGPLVDFFGFPYPTRMAIVQLENRDKACWVWSPTKLTDELRAELQAKQLDNIAYIVSPNKIHHFFLKEWQEAFPKAKVYAPRGLKERAVAKGITFHGVLGEEQMPYEEEISQVIFQGSFFMDEVVFYHKKSQTAIVADLIQRHPEHSLKEGICGTLMKWDGVVGPDGSTPKDYRMTFAWGKDKARQARDVMVDSWEPKHLIIAHGDCLKDGTATMVISKALAWLDKSC